MFYLIIVHYKEKAIGEEKFFLFFQKGGMLMEESNSRNGTYLEALNGLRRMIDEEYAGGGKLPGARVLCKKLNVCLETYMKALRELCGEGVVYTTRGRGGTFVRPANERFLKVGLILINGQESPYLGCGAFFPSIWNVMASAGIHLHLLQSPRIEAIQKTASHHGVSALIWLSPLPSALPVMEHIQQEARYPLVVTDVFHQELRRNMLERKLNLVTNDYSFAGRLVADFFIERKHRSILYIDNRVSMLEHRFPEFFKDTCVSFTPEHNFETKDIEQLLLERIRCLKVTGIFSEGGLSAYQKIVRILMTLPPEERPELIVRKTGESVSFLREASGELRIPAFVATDYAKLGRTAAEQIVECLKSGGTVHPAVIPATTIEPLSSL